MFVCAFVSARIICTHLYVDVIVSHVHSVAYRPEKILNMHKKRKFELNGRRNHRNVVACEQFLCAKSNYELFFSFFSLVQQQQLLYLYKLCEIVQENENVLLFLLNSIAQFRIYPGLFRFFFFLRFGPGLFVPSSHFNSRLENAIKYANS